MYKLKVNSHIVAKSESYELLLSHAIHCAKCTSSRNTVYCIENETGVIDRFCATYAYAYADEC